MKMKLKLITVALLASVAMLVPVQGGGHQGNGGGGSFGGGGGGAARGGGAPSFHSMPVGRFGGGPAFRSLPTRSFGGNRMIYPGQRFSSVGPRSPASMEFRPRSVNSNAGPIRAQQFAQGNNNRVDRVPRFANGRNQSVANARGARSSQFRNRNATLRSDWRNHVFAQHSANWHRDWDRHHDHFFHGHRFVFIDGFWWGFDLGWWPWWYYPYDYYGYGYPYPYSYSYGYNYEPGYDDSGDYDDPNSYSDQSGSSTVAAVQQRLARDGYYRGQIDGVFGPETRAAIAEFQTNHNLRVTGTLNNDTIAALGLHQVASY